MPAGFSNKVSFSPIVPSASHTPPGTPPGAAPGAASGAAPGIQLLPGSPTSQDQISNSTIDEIKEAFSELSVKEAFIELSVEIYSMADRLVNRFDQVYQQL